MQKLRFRFFNRIYAFIFCYFWASCPKCGKMFGGHESGSTSVPDTKDSFTGWICCKEC